MNQYEPYWPFSEIRFSRPQCIWLINILAFIREVQPWPHDPRNPNQIEAPYRKKPRINHTYFEGPEMIAAELESRLEACGIDGCLAEAYYGWNKNLSSLTKYFHMDEKELKKRVGRCLKYISGRDRKKVSYREFVGHRKSRSSCGKIRPMRIEAKLSLNNALFPA